MVDPSEKPNARGKTGEGPGRVPAAGTPRWVKVSGLALIVVLLFVVLHLATGSGDHGPGRHLGGEAPLVGVTETAAGPNAGGIG
ncbi:hypothetical protein PV963_18230 [Streptomyces coeruleorubidus]|uniref:hypothetical protein n=1 Tax=Streptomyces coeruleorubidus TaxID=116188 RepID=UPI00237F4016|nr:hypothetical protein [Streptomyces coeruleorubidus]WDV52175.1 hypothetical protein PV963_18230 [Streptomyces coeruleorubidus]